MDHQAQAGDGRRNPDGGVYASNGAHAGGLGRGDGVPRKHVNELCGNRRAVTAATALILARVFGNSADFWLNTQRRNDLWTVMNTPEQRERVERARPLPKAA